MPVIITHPTGNVFFRAAARGFYDAGILHSIYTSVASFPGTIPYSLGAINIFSDIRRRAMENTFRHLTHTHPWKETGRLVATKLHRQKMVQHETGKFSTDAVYKSLDNHVSKKIGKEKAKGASAVYAYEDGALQTFTRSKDVGLECLYDLPIGYWRVMHDMLAAEKELNPEWAVTLGGLKDSAAKLNRKDEEISLADKIFVAGSFTLKTLKTYPGKLPQVFVVPYGFPEAKAKQYRSFAASQKLKILFVGGLSQRKGLSYMFKAMEGLEDHIALTIVGRMENYDCKPLVQNLRKHTWIETLSNDKVLDLMQENDLLLFPSLFEGFGQVITEAMAQGTPVITTERTAGIDLIEHGENGWLAEAGSAEAIQNILHELISTPRLISQVGTAALETAKKRPWSVYGQELAQAVERSRK